MARRQISFGLTLLFSVGLFLSLINPASAQVRVNVGGMDYDITTNIGSFNDVQTATGNGLTNTTTAPWFGSETTAEAFRDAWFGAANLAAFPTNFTLYFAFNTNVDAPSVFRTTGAVSTFPAFGANDPADAIIGGSTVSYATAALVVEVPEVNGSALAQMLLVLTVVYMLAAARRRENGLNSVV